LSIIPREKLSSPLVTTAEAGLLPLDQELQRLDRSEIHDREQIGSVATAAMVGSAPGTPPHIWRGTVRPPEPMMKSAIPHFAEGCDEREEHPGG
jgi:hypothetical protein